MPDDLTARIDLNLTSLKQGLARALAAQPDDKAELERAQKRYDGTLEYIRSTQARIKELEGFKLKVVRSGVCSQ